jgi:hypothetical protein
VSYRPEPPRNSDPAAYTFHELQDLARALEEAKEHVTWQTLNAAPARPVEGMVVKADGTNWNPGSGAGTYQYRAGTWRPWEGGGGGGTESNGFGYVAVSGQTTVAADNGADTLTLVAGSNVTITTNAATDTITISATGGGGGGSSNSYFPGGWL